MEYRRLGDLTISEVGFGTIPILRGPQNILPRYYNLDETSAIRLLREAYDQGITFYDTAVVPEYGDAESKLGKAFSETRTKVVLSSKSRAYTRSTMRAAIERSLHNMKTSWIDVYSIHQVKPESIDASLDDEHGALAALLEAKKEGKIREIGVGTHYAVIAARASLHPEITVVQIPYNILETGIYETARELSPEINAKLLFHKILAGSALTSHFPIEFLLSDALRRSPKSVLVGLGTPYQLAALLSSYESRSAADFSAFSSALSHTFLCNRCQKCACPEEVDIPHLMRYRAYALLGLNRWARGQWADREALPMNCRNGCTRCVPTCPRHLDIPSLIGEAHTILHG